jgi:hypothetical protein
VPFIDKVTELNMQKKVSTVMVNNSTNISKMYNHLTSKQLNIKKMTTYSVTNPGPDLGQPQKCKTGFVGSQLFSHTPFDIGSLTAIQI